MKTIMRVQATENDTKAIIQTVTNFNGIDKMKEFSEIRNQFFDAEKLGMKWNEKTGEYLIEINLTPEDAQPFVKYAEKKNIEIIMQ